MKKEILVLGRSAVFVLGLLVSISAFAGDIVDDVREECGVYVGPSRVKHQYCIYTPIDQHGDQPRQVLFHFPGYPETVFAGRNLVGIYSFYFKASQRVTPFFVTLYSGKLNAFSDVVENGTQLSTLDSFVTEFAPWLKTKLPIVGNTFAFGYSLGGQNILQLQSRFPGIFSGISISCPALFTASPFHGLIGAYRYARKTSARVWPVYMYFVKIRGYFKNFKIWSRNNILSHLDRFDVGREKMPYIYLSANTQDELGFETGSEIFYRELRAKGYPIEFERRPGGHISFSFANQINSLIQNTSLGMLE